MTDFTSRRMTMVDTQVRPSDVTKFPIIQALLTIPREAFVPDDRREAAYVGENLSLGAGRVVLEARTLAKLMDALDIQPGARVLDIGCALGYSAAVLAHLAGSVVALEEDAGLSVEAGRRLGAQGVGNVTLVNGPLAAGVTTGGAFDVIMIEGGVETVPAAILAQLKEGGRIGALFMQGGLGTARIGVKERGQVSWRDTFNATAPVLPGFAKVREFSL